MPMPSNMTFDSNIFNFYKLLFHGELQESKLQPGLFLGVCNTCHRTEPHYHESKMHKNDKVTYKMNFLFLTSRPLLRNNLVLY